jgi:hypothetical protein
MTTAGFAYVENSTMQNLKQYLEALAERHSKYRLKLLELCAVRDLAMETFWRAMIEYAKLVAFLHGNPALARDVKVSLVWPGDSRAGEEMIQSLFATLHEAWNSYPNCAEALEKTLTDIWFAVSKAEGYRFEIRSEGDYLWLK